MICAWDAFVSLLPIWMRDFVDKQGREKLQEMRLRLNKPPVLVLNDRNVFMQRSVTSDDLTFCINVATKYSPWSIPSGAQGYYTAPGGHRIGICGVLSTDQCTGRVPVMQKITSICIRVCRDFPGLTNKLSDIGGSVLIIGAPGCGKTTFLRDYIRQLSNRLFVSVVDERQEIFPQVHGEYCFDTGVHTDIVYGCSKEHGINMLLRNMGPQVIVVDEITAKEDCAALIHAGWCGVDLIATAHASSKRDLFSRSVYRPIVDSDLFRQLVVMQPDKTWHLERI